MSKDWRVGFRHVMDRCARRLYVVGDPRRHHRMLRRRTGTGPSGPSEKVVKRK